MLQSPPAALIQLTVERRVRDLESLQGEGQPAAVDRSALRDGSGVVGTFIVYVRKSASIRPSGWIDFVALPVTRETLTGSNRRATQSSRRTPLAMRDRAVWFRTDRIAQESQKNRRRRRHAAITAAPIRAQTIEAGSGTDAAMMLTVPEVLPNGTAEISLKLLSTTLK